MEMRIENNFKVSGTSPATNDDSPAIKQGYVVKSGDTVYKLQKAFNFSSEADFRKFVKISGTASLQKDQTLNVPTTKFETTFSAIARKYNMSVEDLKALNPQIKDVARISRGAQINVPIKPYKSEDNKKEAPQNKTENTSPEIKRVHKENHEPKPIHKSEPKAVPPTVSPAKNVTVSMDNPQKIAENLYKAADENTSAVGKKEFDDELNKINKKNVIDVIEQYDEQHPKESLINTICSEVGSSKDARKQAVMKIFDNLSEKVGDEIADENERKSFEHILDDEFNSWGFVSTKEMDTKIAGMIKAYKVGGENSSEGISSRNSTSKKGPLVKLGNGKSLNAGELKRDADNTGIKHNRPVKRPMPIVDDNGNISAEVKTFSPSDKGPLKGKTIIINAGHGGYNPKNGSFDPGTYAADSKGKVIEEWYKNKNFTDKIIPELTAKGAKVIFISGAAASVIKAKKQYPNADLFISIHCDSADGNKSKNGQTILYRGESPRSKHLAGILEKNIEEHEWVNKDNCKTKEDERGLGVLKAASNVPSILIETGFQSNKRDLANIDSETFRTEFAKNLANGVIKYFGK